MRLALAANTGLVADEAYHWVWSRSLAAGYYDQPPAIAWLIRATTLLGTSEASVRLGALGCGVVAALATAWASDRPVRSVVLWLGVPPLAALTLLATPDAPLLAGWAVCVAAATRGGRWWLLAGLGAGLAAMSKHSGLAVLPLAMVALPGDLRTRWPWVGVGIAAICLAPNLVWNATHDWVTVAFQAREGLGVAEALGLGGVGVQLRDQVLVVTPVLWGAGLVWVVTRAMRWRETSRVERVAWMTGVPVLIGFALAALRGVPEAHWTAPAIASLALGLAGVRAGLARVVDLGLGVAALVTAAAAIHVFWPWLPLDPDPGARFGEGPALGEAVRDLVAREQLPVVAERYQEAALIRWYTGIEAVRPAGCGRDDQYGLWPHEEPERAWMIRPARSGAALCSPRWVPEAPPVRLAPADSAGRSVGPWQAIQARRHPRSEGPAGGPFHRSPPKAP